MRAIVLAVVLLMCADRRASADELSDDSYIRVTRNGQAVYTPPEDLRRMVHQGWRVESLDDYLDRITKEARDEQDTPGAATYIWLIVGAIVAGYSMVELGKWAIKP